MPSNQNSLKLDIVERLGLDEESGSLVDDTVLCKDLLLDVMLFRLGELSLFKLEETGLRKEEDCCSLNMDMELRGATTETPALLDRGWLPPLTTDPLRPSLLLFRRFFVRSRILVSAPPALELRFSPAVDSVNSDRLEPRTEPFLSAEDRRSNTLEVEGAFLADEVVGFVSLWIPNKES